MYKNASRNLNKQHRVYRSRYAEKSTMTSDYASNLDPSSIEHWKQCSSYHMQYNLNGEILDYWPSKNKFRFNNETYELNGSIVDVINGLKT